VNEVSTGLGASASSVMLLSETGPELRMAASHGYDEALVQSFRVLALDSPAPIAQAFREAAPIWIPDLSAMASLPEPIAGAAARSKNRSGAAVPLVVEG